MFSVFTGNTNLDDFNKAIGKIAEKHGESFFHVRIEKENDINGNSTKFSAYIHGLGLKTGKSIKQVCNEFKSA